jgi:hypothetical protein
VRLEAAVRDRLASACVCYSATLKMTSSPIGTPRGRLATPITGRTDVFSMPKDISKQIRDDVRDLGWSTKSPAVAMNTLRRTTRVTLSNEPRCSLADEAQAPTAEMAVTPPSIRKSAPTTYAESSDAR